MKIVPSKDQIVPGLILGIVAVILVKKIAFLNNL